MDKKHRIDRNIILGLLVAGFLLALAKLCGIFGGSWWYAGGPVCAAVVLFVALCFFDLMSDRIIGQNDDHYRAEQRRRERNR